MAIELPRKPRPSAWMEFFAPPPGISWQDIGFALKTTAASLISLYFAFLMDLDNPSWAAVTVWVVAPGDRGMSLSKSLYRIAGTLCGVVVAVILFAFVGQTTELLMPALAIWLGLCTAVATGLRNFRAYAAVLAGYGAMIVSMDAVAAPEHIFDIAVARTTYIILGILVEAVMTAIFAPGAPVRQIRGRLRDYIANVVEVSVRILRGEATADAEYRLFAKALELDTAAEYAARASHLVRQRLGHLREAAAAALEQLALAQVLREHLPRDGGAASGLIGEAVELLAAAPATLAAAQPALSRLRLRVQAALAEEMAGDGSSFPTLLPLDRLEALLAAFQRSLVGQDMLDRAKPPPSRHAYMFHVDRVAAVQNGLRACVAVLAASSFWYLTAWSGGSNFVALLGVVMALYATRPNAVAGGLGFLKGAACAALGAGFCNLVLVPGAADFTELAVILGFFMFCGAIGMRLPRTAAPASSFVVFLLGLVAPENAVRMEAASFFNGALSLLAGIGCGTLVFALLIPADPPAERRRLHHAIRQDLARIGRHPRDWSMAGWLVLTADRMGRLFLTAGAVPPAQADRDLRGLLAAMTLGAAAIELSDAAARQPGAARLAAAVLRHVSDAEPGRLIRTARSAARRFVRQSGGGDARTRRRSLRMAVLLAEIADTATIHAEVLREGTIGN